MNHLKILKFWGYRGAMANHAQGYVLPRGLTYDLESILFEAIGQEADNKCTFMVQDDNGKKFYITFHDSITIISPTAEVIGNELNGKGVEFNPLIKVQ
jgi:hypothetical protein